MLCLAFGKILKIGILFHRNENTVWLIFLVGIFRLTRGHVCLNEEK